MALTVCTAPASVLEYPFRFYCSLESVWHPTVVQEDLVMRRVLFGALTALAIIATASAPAFAQGGGASATGTIQGRVADSSGGVLPGVTVTATSPSMIGAQTQVTNENGSYRFPGGASGRLHAVRSSSPASTSVKREGVSRSRSGFTANVNAET